MSFKRFLLFVGTACCLLGGPRAGQAYSVLGGEVLGVHDQAIRVSVGYPDIAVAWHIPVVRRFEVAPKFTQFYGVDTHVPIVGNTFGAELRWQVYGKGRLSIALFFDPALVIAYSGVHRTTVGVSFGLPGVRLGYLATGNLHIVGGVRMPLALHFSPSPVVGRFPVLFEGGLEYMLSTALNVHVLFGIGPDIWVGDGGSNTELYVNGILGISYRF